MDRWVFKNNQNKCVKNRGKSGGGGSLGVKMTQPYQSSDLDPVAELWETASLKEGNTLLLFASLLISQLSR